MQRRRNLGERNPLASKCLYVVMLLYGLGAPAATMSLPFTWSLDVEAHEIFSAASQREPTRDNSSGRT